MGGWRLGRLGGIEIRVDPSWSIIAVLFTLSFWASFSDRSRFVRMNICRAGSREGKSAGS